MDIQQQNVSFNPLLLCYGDTHESKINHDMALVLILLSTCVWKEAISGAHTGRVGAGRWTWEKRNGRKRGRGFSNSIRRGGKDGNGRRRERRGWRWLCSEGHEAEATVSFPQPREFSSDAIYRQWRGRSYPAETGQVEEWQEVHQWWTENKGRPSFLATFTFRLNITQLKCKGGVFSF